MKKTILLLATVGMALLLSTGLALAANITCQGGVCEGTNDADLMRGTPGFDNMSGNSGHDRMNGGGGNDIIFGDNGGDTINGSYGSDRINGGPIGDTLQGGAAKDRIIAGTGVDTVYGNSSDDYIIIAGDNQNDFVNCGTGRDILVLDAEEMMPPNLDQFVNQTSCEVLRIR